MPDFEKQILLLKLVHEYETVPDFGNDHINDVKSPQLQWIARTGALVRRLGSVPF